MTPAVLKRAQPSRNSISPLVEAAKPNLKSRLRHRSRWSLRLGRSHLIDISAGGWRRFGGPPPASCGGWWDQIGDRTRRPDSIVLRYGCLRPRPNNRLSSSLSTPLRRLSSPPSLPSRIERHLAHFAHPVLRNPGDHQRLVDPRLKLVQGRHGAAGNYPVLGVVAPIALHQPKNLGRAEAEKPQFGRNQLPRPYSAKEASRIAWASIAARTAGSQSVCTSWRRSSA
jgi:hypothetical protein